MVIELYGIPGAGKSTLISKVRTSNAVSYSGEYGVKGFVVKVAKWLSTFLPSSIKYKCKIKKIIGNQDLVPIYTSASVRKNLNILVMTAFGYKHIKGNVFMDEGLFHRVMTFSIKYTIIIYG